jgi:exodeoxyribonuclease VII large subunit
VKAREHRLLQALARFSPEPLKRRLDQRAARLESIGGRLIALPRRIERDDARLAALSRALSGLNPKTPKPGFARVEAEDGAMIAAAAALQDGQVVRLIFADSARGARIEGGEPAPAPARASAPSPRAKVPPPGQGDLF